MRSYVIIVLAAIGTGPLSGYAQEVIPDTLDWHGYFPLQVGNVWQYRYQYFNPAYVEAEWLEQWVAAGDTSIEGQEYVRLEVTCETVFNIEGWPGPCDRAQDGQRLARYDGAAAGVYERIETDLAEERPYFIYDFRLDAAFSSMSEPTELGQYYYSVPDEAVWLVSLDTVRTALKQVVVFSGVPGELVFGHGIGLIHSEFDEFGGDRRTLLYASIDGIETGTRVPIGTEKVSSYLPLEVGDTWTYITVLDPPNAPPDTVWRGTFSVSESVVRDGKAYQVTGFPFALADTLRADEQGRIWSFSGGRDILFLDFMLDEGARYRFPDPLATRDSFEVSIERNVTADVGAGRFEDCVRVLFDHPALDADRVYAFAPGVGVVYAYGVLGDYAELHTAVVGGQVIAGVESSDRSLAGRSLYVYPNPLSETGVVSFSSGSAAAIAVELFDLLGRKVETLAEDYFIPGRQTLTFDASSLPAGVYFVRLRDGDQTEIRSLVVAR